MQSSDTTSTQWTRREWLRAGAVGAAIAANMPLSALADDSAAAGLVDAHSHIWTRDVEKFPLAKGQTVDDLDPPSFTAEELIRVARPVGVTRVVLIQHHRYHGWDNSYLIDAARRYPDRFRVVGMVDDRAPHPDAAMRKLLKQKVTAFRITPWIRDKKTWLDGPGMAAMWKCAAETRQAMCCLIDRDDLDAVDAMCQKNLDTPVVIDHFARIGVDGNVRAADVKRLCKLARHKNSSVKISAYYALGKKKPPYLDLVPMIRQVLDAFGPQRSMWASDSPYQLADEHTYKASIDLVRKHLDFVTDDDRQWLLKKSAEKVYYFDA